MPIFPDLSYTADAKRLSLPPAVVFGRSEAMKAVRVCIEKAASTGVPILIHGESGTGKEVLARLIHESASTHREQFVKINCPALSGTLMERELFRSDHGAFPESYSYTVPDRRSSTLFFDEIGELSQDLQSRLLLLLQDKHVYTAGSQQSEFFGARVVCATTHELERDVDTKSFRQDLFYRISVICIAVPPLRHRVQDIPILIDYFLQHYSAIYKSPVRTPAPEVIRKLQAYRWPGNVRQLENAIQRYTILGSVDALFDNMHGKPGAEEFEFAWDANGVIPLREVTRKAMRRIERNIILKALHRNQWNRKETARTLKISYRALFYKLKVTGIEETMDGSLRVENRRATEVQE